MTGKSKRELEREVRELSDPGGDDSSGIVIVWEHDDGTLTDPEGEPLPADAQENAGMVLNVSWDVARTWP